MPKKTYPRLLPSLFFFLFLSSLQVSHCFAHEESTLTFYSNTILDIDQIKGLMRKNEERTIPSIKTEEFTFFIDLEDTTAYWEHRQNFDWNSFWKCEKIGSDLYNKIKGPMFKQIRTLLEYGWTKEEVIQRLIRGYFVAHSEEKIIFEGTEWLPDWDEIVTNIQAKKYNFVVYTHAMATFGAYEAKELLQALEGLILNRNLNASILFICGSDLGKYEEIDLYKDVELEVINQIKELNDPKGHLNEYLNWYNGNFSKIRFFCLTHLRKDQQQSWDFVFKNFLKIDPAVSNVALFDNEEKNRNAFLDFLRTVR